MQAFNPKGNQSWIFIGRTHAEAETSMLWPPDTKNWLTWKDPDAGKDWRWEEKGTTEDEIIGWHHWFNGHEFVKAQGDGEGQGGLECCSPWGHKELNTAEQKQPSVVHLCSLGAVWPKAVSSLQLPHMETENNKSSKVLRLLWRYNEMMYINA